MSRLKAPLVGNGPGAMNESSRNVTRIVEAQFAGEVERATSPVVVDFYATWCGPCKMVALVLEELKAEYDDKLEIYKVNTEEERELSAMFGIQSIPSLLFIPLTGQPQMALGALPKETFKKAIGDVLSVKP